MNKRLFYRIMNLWPPFLGGGISFNVAQENPLIFDVKLKFSWYNRNYVGVQYGGSLYSMADPWFMLILMDALGKKFLVWDKAASISFLKPGKSAVHARFEIAKAQIEEIRQQALEQGKVEPKFIAHIYDEDGQEIARVEKTLWVKRKK